jgi:hypothetical protein
MMAIIFPIIEQIQVRYQIAIPSILWNNSIGCAYQIERDG